MGSKGVAATTILILSIIIFFFTTPTSAQAPPVVSPPPSTCPNLRVCVSLLQNLVGIVVSPLQSKPCCSLIANLVDLDAALCLCTAIKLNVLGINPNIPLNLALVVCGRNTSINFVCS
ncbi:pEARLI1-like lipid transfer protein 3 [Vicia villosa]|uniref:pEARLI1-like lipid transfer protein 3 n=1 Tax=Vicia villosa TaxID=3911 RepID=UPI00273BE344|nr:pEARLI1-like lipid transfer protein 3 [Vicia villosa]